MAEDDGVRRAALMRLTVRDLKAKCKERGLRVSGPKKVLVDRLLDPNHPASQPKTVATVIPCEQFLYWAGLARTGFIGGLKLTPEFARKCLPNFSRTAVIALLNLTASVSVNPQVSPAVKRAERTFFRGKDHHVDDVVFYKQGKAVLLCVGVAASMRDDKYHAFLLFVQEDSEDTPKCHLVRFYCECHYGFSVQCGHKAALLLSVGLLQGAYVKKDYSTEDAIEEHRLKYE
mmetsp:Transcript_5915/g.23303  ORF Transcript_5915/g.23303 Transcript_5915/m.23303 type:complete len:231 (-) Transcript_5915:20-712(-)